MIILPSVWQICWQGCCWLNMRFALCWPFTMVYIDKATGMCYWKMSCLLLCTLWFWFISENFQMFVWTIRMCNERLLWGTTSCSRREILWTNSQHQASHGSRMFAGCLQGGGMQLQERTEVTSPTYFESVGVCVASFRYTSVPAVAIISPCGVSIETTFIRSHSVSTLMILTPGQTNQPCQFHLIFLLGYYIWSDPI
jgi:hypothetical protein